MNNRQRLLSAPEWACASALLAAAAGLICCAAGEAAPPRQNADQGRFMDAHVHFHDCKAGDLDRAAEWMKSNNVQRVLNYPLAQSRPRNDGERRQMLENYAKHKGRIARACVIFPEGRITTTGALMKVYEGPAVIAERAGAADRKSVV